MDDYNNIRFIQLNSIIETAFWMKLSKRKLKKYKLSEEMQEANEIIYNPLAGKNVIGNIFLDFDSFDLRKRLNRGSIKIGCDIVVLNTKNAFLTLNKADIIKKSALKFIHQKWDNLNEINYCNYFRVLLVCFIDLKKHKFMYWFAFPHLKLVKRKISNNDISLIDNGSKTTLITQLFEETEILKMYNAIDNYINKNPNNFLYFWLCGEAGQYKCFNINEILFDSFIDDQKNQKIYLVFFDSCYVTETNTFGWIMKPLIVYLMNHYPNVCKKRLDVISLRDFFNENLEKSVYFPFGPINSLFNIDVNDEKEDVFTGIEIKRNKIIQTLNLNSIMSPLKLAESNAELNLRLMTWRLAPDMNIDRFKSVCCLIIGAGTLGCNVARGLLGWGVRNITFVDNGVVSYSNPIRQSLYKFNDCKINSDKATTAAEALTEIAPFISASGYKLSVPIPGQLITDEEQLKADISQLETLILKNDIIFMMTDTRESRWLPTLLSFVHHKVVINAAVGFDSFMVIRYGGPPGTLTDSFNDSFVISSENLACYFCSDSVIPQDTQINRAIDQQCTVTRPGISMMASAHAVEIFASLLQSSPSMDVPYVQSYNNPSCITGVPHIVRFFLTTNQTLNLGGQRYSGCVACSPEVLSEYINKGYGYILSVIRNPNLLKLSSSAEQKTNTTKETDQNNRKENVFDDFELV